MKARLLIHQLANDFRVTSAALEADQQDINDKVFFFPALKEMLGKVYFANINRQRIAWLNNPVDAFTSGLKDKLFKDFDALEASVEENMRRAFVLHLQTPFGTFMIHRCGVYDGRGALCLKRHATDTSRYVIEPYENWIRGRLEQSGHPMVENE